MTTATATLVDPIAAAIADAEARVAADQLRKEQEAAERARTREEARLRKENERRLELANNMINGFKRSVANYMIEKKWSPEGMKEANTYVEAILKTKDDDVPNVSNSIARMVQEKFAYGIYMYNDVIPEGFFVGQRQEWFAPLYERNLSKKAASKKGA